MHGKKRQTCQFISCVFSNSIPNRFEVPRPTFWGERNSPALCSLRPSGPELSAGEGDEPQCRRGRRASVQARETEPQNAGGSRSQEGGLCGIFFFLKQQAVEEGAHNSADNGGYPEEPQLV